LGYISQNAFPQGNFFHWGHAVSLEAKIPAVNALVAAYHENWRLQKRGFMTPLKYRAALARKAA
jgi:hypothetical protein